MTRDSQVLLVLEILKYKHGVFLYNIPHCNTAKSLCHRSSVGSISLVVCCLHRAKFQVAYVLEQPQPLTNHCFEIVSHFTYIFHRPFLPLSFL